MAVMVDWKASIELLYFFRHTDIGAGFDGNVDGQKVAAGIAEEGIQRKSQQPKRKGRRKGRANEENNPPDIPCEVGADPIQACCKICLARHYLQFSSRNL